MSEELVSGKTVQLEQVPAKFCPRRLKPGMCKRYMSTGPLYGYMLACPCCGFVELHADKAAGFIEENERLSATKQPVSCMNCRATISVTNGAVVGVKADAGTPA